MMVKWNKIIDFYYGKGTNSYICIIELFTAFYVMININSQTLILLWEVIMIMREENFIWNVIPNKLSMAVYVSWCAFGNSTTATSFAKYSFITYDSLMGQLCVEKSLMTFIFRSIAKRCSHKAGRFCKQGHICHI